MYNADYFCRRVSIDIERCCDDLTFLASAVRLVGRAAHVSDERAILRNYLRDALRDEIGQRRVKQDVWINIFISCL